MLAENSQSIEKICCLHEVYLYWMDLDLLVQPGVLRFHRTTVVAVCQISSFAASLQYLSEMVRVRSLKI